jgi:phosphoribosylglycinamide formyltransferase 1
MRRRLRQEGIMNTTTLPLSVAVFISGGGRSLANLIDHRDHHGLPIDIRLVISSRSDVAGVAISQNAGIQTLVVPKTKGIDDASFCRLMFDPVRACGAQWVIMAGYLKHVMIPDDFQNRVINIHPSLLPAFGGPGMYGDRVHQAVIDRQVALSGCTVHFVDNHYDNGPIILQKWCEVAPGETVLSLAAKVFELEKVALPQAIRKIAGG